MRSDAAGTVGSDAGQFVSQLGDPVCSEDEGPAIGGFDAHVGLAGQDGQLLIGEVTEADGDRIHTPIISLFGTDIPELRQFSGSPATERTWG